MAGIDQNTLLMLAGDSFTDLSPLQKNVTNSGVSISHETHFSNCKSFYFDGFSKIFIEPSNLGSTDFTFDWWENVTTAGGQRIRFSTYYGSGQNFGGLIAGLLLTKLYCGSGLNNWSIASGSVLFDYTVNSWVHWALVRNGDYFKTYKNGKLFSSIPISNGSPIYNDDSVNWALGGYREADDSTFSGYIQEFRVSNIARWTSNFTPPTTPYSPDIASPSIFVPSSVIAGGQFVVSWSAVENAASYTLEQQTDGGDWSQVYTGAGTNYQATAAGSAMAFRVLATDADGNESEYATSGNVKIFPNISGTRFGGVIING